MPAPAWSTGHSFKAGRPPWDALRSTKPPQSKASCCRRTSTPRDVGLGEGETARRDRRWETLRRFPVWGGGARVPEEVEAAPVRPGYEFGSLASRLLLF